MTVKALFIKKIEQVNNTQFSIIWNDDQKQIFQLSDLQKVCPCANCIDENTGVRKIHPNNINEQVRAQWIRSIGRYALQIQFTSGCTTGIFSFHQLRELEKK